MNTNYSDTELIQMKQLQKQHLKELLTQFIDNITDKDIDTVISIVTKSVFYHELHMESVKRKLENSMTPEMKKMI
jgi:hypothetical protein